mgnify:CR=1 FL=1
MLYFGKFLQKHFREILYLFYFRAKVLTGTEIDLDQKTETEKPDDMTFVFHSGEGDSEERVVHEDADGDKYRALGDEPRWRIFCQHHGQ